MIPRAPVGGGDAIALRLVLLWLCGAALRITILAAAPLTPLIRAELHLSATQLGLVVSLPIALFALAALPGSLLAARAGIKRALIVGLLLVAAGGALRGATTGVLQLYAAIVVMGLGAAMLQPVMPIAVRAWLPQRIGFGTALFTNGLLVGEALPVMISLPLLLPLLGGWRPEIALWSVPVLLTAGLAAYGAPRRTAAEAEVARNARWWPDWRSPLTWQLGVLFGSVNGAYFGANSYLPEYLTSTGHPELISAALSSLNLAQLPASFALLAVARRLERRTWPYLAAALGIAASVAGLALGGPGAIVAWAAVLGLTGTVALVMALTLPPLLSAPGDVGRVSASMFTISYATGMLVALAAGLAWDASGRPVLAFVPIGACALVLAGAALSLRRSRALS